MTTPNLTAISFAPYRLVSNTQNELVVEGESTLREAVLYTYVKGAAAWMLGYQANSSFPVKGQVGNTPLRAQQLESPFETAWSILLLLDAADLLGQSCPEFVQETYRKVPDAVSWLIKKGKEFAKNDEETRINWEDWYDTAIITQSLLCAQEAALIPDSLCSSIPLHIEGALAWLKDKTYQRPSPPYKITHRVVNDLALHGGESLAMMVSTMFYTYKMAPKDFKHIFGLGRRGDKLHPALWSLIHETTTFVEQAYKYPLDSESRPSYLPIRYEILIAMANMLLENYAQKLRFPVDKVNTMRSLLIQGTEMLESIILREDFQIDTSNRADRLTAYIRSLRALEIEADENKFVSFARPDLVMSQLRSIVHAVDPFWDGSTYHSLHATRHTLRCFLEVCRWSGASRKIIELYDDQLKASPLYLFNERKQFYESQRHLIHTEQQLATQQRQYEHLLEYHRWIRRGFITVLALFVIVLLLGLALPFLHFGHLNVNLSIDPGSGEGFITLIVTCTGLAGFIGYLIDRFLSRREQ